MAAQSMLTTTASGLYCAAGDFHIDPWRPVARAVITHAHSDHARVGSAAYLATRQSGPILRARLGREIALQEVGYGEVVTLGAARVSLHPAGHVVGSAQVRIEVGGRVCVVTGDYKIASDPTCAAFEPVVCDEFITESTFGLPIYRWPDAGEVFAQINAWWMKNAAMGRTSVIFAYSLGKAQRILEGVDKSIGPLGVHGAVARMNEACQAAGVVLPAAVVATGEGRKVVQGRGLVVAPPSVDATVWLRKLGGREGVATAAASGWMAIRGNRRRQSVDRGFVLSDHADWDGLQWAIRASGAELVGVTHGSVEPMVRWLREQGREAYAIRTQFSGRGEEASEDADDDPAKQGTVEG